MRTANKKPEPPTLLSKLARVAGDPDAGTGRLAAFLKRHPELRSPETVEKLAELAREKVRVDALESLQYAEAALAMAEPSAMQNRRRVDCGPKPTRCGS